VASWKPNSVGSTDTFVWCVGLALHTTFGWSVGLAPHITFHTTCGWYVGSTYNVWVVCWLALHTMFGWCVGSTHKRLNGVLALHTMLGGVYVAMWQGSKMSSLLFHSWTGVGRRFPP
jgi:hypothetical protein